MKALYTKCLVLVIPMALLCCRNDAPVIPKPRVYPRVYYPEKEYVKLRIADCPFEMQAPTYFTYTQDSVLQREFPQSECWFDLSSQSLNTSLHFSYLPVDSRSHLDVLINDAFEMADKHNIKANYRDEHTISRGNDKVYGLLFEIDGAVAAPLQFFLTDSTSHFLRGSLYFNAQVNRDSVAPVYDFLKEDISIMLESFQWKQ